MNHRLARTVAELRWFFHQAKAEMGIRSSWEPLMRMAQNGGMPVGQQHDHEHEVRRLAASRRHARVEAALRAIGPEALALIRLTCEEETQTLRLAYGPLGNLAHLAYNAVRAHRASRTKRPLPMWLDRLAFKLARGTAPPGDRDTADSIRIGCEELMEQVRDDYVKAMARRAQ